MKNAQSDRRSKYSRHALSEALLHILESKDLDSISITEVCKVADVNRGTFYKYYRDIYELYDQIEDEFVEGLRELLSDTSEQMQEMFYAKLTAMLQSKRSFLRPRHRGADSARLLGKLLALVLPGMTQQVLQHRRDLKEEEARFLGEYIIGGCARVYGIWIEENMSVPGEELQQYIESFVNTSLNIKRPSTPARR